MTTTITIYDSDCISSFLKINEVKLLKKLFSQILVPKQVYDEITTPDSYWQVRKLAISLKNNGYLKIIPIETSYQSLKNYNSMIKGKWGRPIGRGEAAALSLAILNNGIIASNNLKDVKDIAQKNSIPIMTSSIILTALYEKGVLSKSEVESVWAEMKKRDTILPTKTFEIYYKTLFKKDYKDFNLKKYYGNLIQTE